jgi:F0F1-type ATP synthase assembly protein I
MSRPLPIARVRSLVRLALTLTLSGLVVQLLTALYWTPLTFVLSAVLGVGPLVAGSVLFLWTVWHTVEHHGAPHVLAKDAPQPRAHEEQS